MNFGRNKVFIVFGGVLGLVFIASSILGAPPVEPLGTPLYSFDQASPSVLSGAVNSTDVLTLNLPYPKAVISRTELGLAAAGDELDALSGGNPHFSPLSTFGFRFSVTRATTGDVPVDPSMLLMNIPYNVMDQAGRGHQAGDEFMSMRVYTIANGEAPKPDARDNNTMVNNNYDEGGSDFAGRPETSATTMTVGQPQDNVDALANVDATAAIFYSASSASPSLATLPGSTNPSGARIYRLFAGTISVYASPADLGLLQADDIDAMVVFDLNVDGVFNQQDTVLFSLTPGSPSVNVIPGVSANGGADIFIAKVAAAPKVFVPAARLGLAGPSDDLDALEILKCHQPGTCSALHAIRN